MKQYKSITRRLLSLILTLALLFGAAQGIEGFANIEDSPIPPTSLNIYYGSLNANAALQVNGSHTVTYDFNDGIRPSVALYALPGSELLEPDLPERAGFVFDYWSLDMAGESIFDFETAISGDITLYAQWFHVLSGTFASEFPDANFCSEVLRSLNTLGGEIRTSSSLIAIDDLNALATIDALNLRSRNIEKLQGLKYFTGLMLLHCASNQLRELDVSQNKALTILRCGSNQLTELDVSNNPALANLNCEENQLTKLDVSANTALISLDCYKNNLTVLLGVSDNNALSYLLCHYNQLTELDASNNPALIQIECDYNRLIELNVSNCPALMWLYCDNNRLISEDAIIGFEAIMNQTVNIIAGDQSPVVTIISQPKDLLQVTQNEITENLSVTVREAQMKGVRVSYQWYNSTLPDGGGEVPINDECSETLKIPTALPVGTYYYYCEIVVRSEWAGELKAVSDVATVKVNAASTPTPTPTPTPSPTPSPTPGRKLGDVNGDGEIVLKDVQMALRAYLQLVILNTEETWAADVNADGEVDLRDVQMILKATLALITLEESGTKIMRLADSSMPFYKNYIFSQ